ncbi:MAG: methionyl-tRNA formyltransferase [Pseudomonadota bacterium]|nr:methionyl-tRNA formyltransferase [Pseudomonadota bacterium]
MRLVFAGTPEFSVTALDALHRAGHEIVGVFTQPDRPAGRGRKLSPSPVAERAAGLNLPVYKPERLREDAQQILRELAPEVMVVVAYGLILPQAVLDIPTHGCLNIHASLLPRWRGAAPIQRAIEAGDAQTGVTIMRMEKGLDTGPMLLVESTPITPRTTAASLHDTLAEIGGRLIVTALEKLAKNPLPEQVQPAEGVTYASKLSKAEGQIDWTLPASEIERRIRAFNPFPVAWSSLAGERVRILQAQAIDGSIDAKSGSVRAGQTLDVACGRGHLRIEQIQWPGSRVVSGQEALGARALNGLRFEHVDD